MCTSELVAEIRFMVRKKNKHLWKQFVSSEYNSLQEIPSVILFNSFSVLDLPVHHLYKEESWEIISELGSTLVVWKGLECVRLL